MNKYQKLESNSDWSDLLNEDVNFYLERVRPDDRASLESGNKVDYQLRDGDFGLINPGHEWYQKIRLIPAVNPQPKAELIECDCGHAIAKDTVMWASMGSSCPDCYDRMSG